MKNLIIILCLAIGLNSCANQTSAIEVSNDNFLREQAQLIVKQNEKRSIIKKQKDKEKVKKVSKPQKQHLAFNFY